MDGEGAGELLSLLARLGMQGVEEQETTIRNQLQHKIMGFFDIFQQMEEKVASLERLIDQKDSQLAQMKAGEESFPEGPKKLRNCETAELTIRLELEHDRRVRAQEAIGDIEKERILLKQKLDIRNSDYEKKSQEFDEVKLGCDYKIAKITAEMKKLETKLLTVSGDKDKRIHELQDHNNELYMKVEGFEERYNNQLDVSRTLQNELQASYIETKTLLKEMEMLNLMFAELEHHIFTQQTKGTGEIEVNENGKVVKVKDVLATAQSTEPSQSLLQESCFNEVNTKQGTKMVLSVSKTFLKLKDLILEKNTLQDQVTKMKNINEHLCNQVNLHEEKLCGITDELDNTWFYVEKIKVQHKKLHSAEVILRAELAEKRVVLRGLRKELEESRASWNVVKAKTAESEETWIKLKADFAERKRLLASSSESGISDMDASTSADKETWIKLKADFAERKRLLASSSESGISDMDASTSADKETVEETKAMDTDMVPLQEDEEDEISEDIPDPFSDDEEDGDMLNSNFLQPPMAMVTSITSLVNVDIEDEEDDEVEEEKRDTKEDFTPIFVPSLSYLAQVPSELQANMLGSGKAAAHIPFAEGRPARERLEDTALEEVDGNVQDLICRLSSSTARGAFLANRLADIHRRIATGSSLTDHNEWFDAEEDETDLEPRETDYEDDMTAASPSLLSDVEETTSLNADSVEDYHTASASPPPVSPTFMDDTAASRDGDSRSSSPDSMVLAIDEAINILDPPRSTGITAAPPPPNFSIFLGATATEPAFVPLPEDDEADEDDEEDPTGRERVETALGQDSSSAAVTRFLIKHLPKQLTQLREEKHQLEDKIHDLESVVSEQRMQMAEHERRVEDAVASAKRMEERLMKEDKQKKADEEKKILAALPMEEKEVGATFRVPVEVQEQDILLSWSVECREERPCSFWLNFIPAGGEECDSVILSCRAQDTTPLDPRGLRSCLQVECAHKGRYTLHIEGSGLRMPQVTVTMTPITERKEL